MRIACLLLILCAWLPFGGGHSVKEKRRKNLHNRKTKTGLRMGVNKVGNRYSTLTQVNTQTIKNLQLAWTFDTGENKSADKGMDMQCQPIVVDGILYGTTPRLKLFALDAATGQEHWRFDPFADPAKKPRFQPMRGVVYWEDGNGADKRILYTPLAPRYTRYQCADRRVDSGVSARRAKWIYTKVWAIKKRWAMKSLNFLSAPRRPAFCTMIC